MAQRKGLDESATSARRLEAKVKQEKAWTLRLAGASYQAIAEAVGYGSHTSARRAVLVALKSRQGRQEDLEHLRSLEVERLDRLQMAYWERATKDDHDAAKIVFGCIDRRASLLGLPAPIRKELSGPNGGAIPLELLDAIMESYEKGELGP